MERAGCSATIKVGQWDLQLLEGPPSGGPSRVLGPGGRTRTGNRPMDSGMLSQLSLMSLGGDAAWA